ncbi:prion-like-(Q/N-rich) domain-bearing protein 25 isoform X1 [Microplitis mediator]|uniref:prion-like-(Q/N-rich) domain-bearing protein 25 isoform X1 n=1 Tax=Microplitis mediator TaxID=375433 RepID=UPI0025542715|nr:prion-like-(Q/N-rich) domain-bearing protein 25 isoform X1 [Microplitis mediator]
MFKKKFLIFNTVLLLLTSVTADRKLFFSSQSGSSEAEKFFDEPRILLRLRQTMKSCIYDTDCIGNAYCFNRETCHCKNGHVINRNHTHMQCLKIATNLGDPCDENIQCEMTFTSQAECRNNICTCIDGSHYEESQGRCYESIGIGKMCKTNYNCYVEGSKTFCVDGYCSCPLLHHPNSDGTRCLKSAFLKDKCSIDEECIAENSRCFGTCSCKLDYVLSKDNKRCLKAANIIGDPCEEDLQCSTFLKNTKCNEDNICTCVLDFKPRESVCLRKINPDMIGKACLSRSQCVHPPADTELKDSEVANVDCLSGICSCAQDYTLTEDKTDCIRFSENGAGKIISTHLLLSLIIIKILQII